MPLACVVVVNEGDSSGGPVARQPWHTALMVNEAPVLGVPHSLRQNALGGEVKQVAASSPLKPVNQSLPWTVLVILQPIVAPPAHRSL